MGDTSVTETSARQRRLIFGALLLVLALLDQTIASTPGRPASASAES